MERAEAVNVNEEEQVKRPKGGSIKKMMRRKYLFVYLMLLPAAINFAIFYVGVNLNSILMAFQTEAGLTDTGYVYEFSWVNFSVFLRNCGYRRRICTSDFSIH